MIELRALGTLDLRRSAGPELHSVLAQPKRTALLAYLALARPHGFHRRDTLLGLFWPEHDAEHARAALRQAVHFLRRSLGEEAIVSRGDEDIGLGDGVLACDAVQFDGALDAGEPERALSLYAGDLLPGFFVEEAPEFERWLDGERTRLRERAVRACWSLAEGQEAIRDFARAAEWGRRALAIAPADDSHIMRLMQLLARTGDRSGALAAFEAYARRLRTELEVEPTEAASALAEQIRKAEPQQPERAKVPAPRATVGVAAASDEPEPGWPDQAPAPPPNEPRSTPHAVISAATQAAAAGQPQIADDESWARPSGRAPGLWRAGIAGILIGIPMALLAVGLGHALWPAAVPLVGAGVLIAAAGLVLVEVVWLTFRLMRRRSARPVARSSARAGAGVGLALGVLVTLSLAFVLAPRSPRAAGTPPPRGRMTHADTVNVTVTPFANLTGDRTLDPVGRLAEDWVIRRLRAIPEADVAAITSAGAADTSLDAVTALAHRTGADLVLFGSYYREGDDVLLTATLVPPRGGRISPNMARLLIGPVRARRERPVAAVDRLASLVAGAVAGKCLFPAGCGPGRHAPMYEARQLFLEAAQALQRGDAETARQRFRQATAVDSMYGSAYTHLAELTSCAQKDSIGEILEARRQDFGLPDLEYMRIIRAICHGDVETVYRIRRQELERASADPTLKGFVAAAAAGSGRLREAERLYREVIAQAGAAPVGDSYMRLADVLHLEGKIAEEISVAAEGRRRLQDLQTADLGLRGLAALGRTQELEAWLDKARRAGATLPYLAANYLGLAMEADWHHQPEAARHFALAALRTLDRVPPADRKPNAFLPFPGYVAMRAFALLELGRWREARELSDAGDPHSALLLVVRGLAAVGAGDSAAARASLAALDRLPDTAFRSQSAYAPLLTRELCQAALLSALGKKDEALRRLEDAQARGTLPRSQPGFAHIAQPGLRALWHDPRFERMFAARD